MANTKKVIRLAAFFATQSTFGSLTRLRVSVTVVITLELSIMENGFSIAAHSEFVNEEKCRSPFRDAKSSAQLSQFAALTSVRCCKRHRIRILF